MPIFLNRNTLRFERYLFYRIFRKKEELFYLSLLIITTLALDIWLKASNIRIFYMLDPIASIMYAWPLVHQIERENFKGKST